jgi:uncharacterized protein YbjT (DUF2867 family)
MPQTAIISGATGLVGEQLLQQLLVHPEYDKVIVITRKTLPFTHEKLEQRVIDFERLPAGLAGIRGDHGFCCLGTTLKAAGSKERQYRIDHDYVIAFATACLDAGVRRFAIVSSIGASALSSNFYLRTKGEMEHDLRKLPFNSLLILQPSLLMGERKESRTGEALAIKIMKYFNPVMIGSLRKYRGVAVNEVARCMIDNIQFSGEGIKVITSDKIC